MECLVNRESEACIEYCKILQTSKSNPSNDTLWECYQSMGVNKQLYGEEKCSQSWDKNTQGNQYLQCLIHHNIPITHKENCDYIVNDDSQLLQCYRAQNQFDFFNTPVPYDRDFCYLEYKVEKVSEYDLFLCYKNFAKINLTRDLCDGLYSDVTDEQVLLERRYKCYETHLGIQKDEEYCHNSSSNNSQYFECLVSVVNRTKGPDYCFFEYYGSEFYPEGVSNIGNHTALWSCLEL